MIRKLLFIALITSIISFEKETPSKFTSDTNLKNIDSLIKVSRNTIYSDSIRNLNLELAYNKTKKLTIGSEKNLLFRRISYSHFALGNIDKYGEFAHKMLKSSIKTFDTLNISKAYWILGHYHEINFKNDSAFCYYSSACKSYTAINQHEYAGRMLLNMGTIQEAVNDLTGSEINLIKAASKLKGSENYKSLYLVHNNLGVTYSKLNRLDLAIKQHEKAIQYLKKIDNKHYEATTLNNIGRIHLKKKNYSQSLKYFEKALAIKDLLQTDPYSYAMILGNLAYSKFKIGQHKELPSLFHRSLKIRDSLQSPDGIAAGNLRLSEYYLFQKDTLKAINCLVKAKETSLKADYNDGLLESYLMLSEIETKEKSNQYLKKYIKLSDSLLQNEREIREKFTRIAYETDEIIKEKEVIANKNWWLTISIIIGGGFFIIVYFYIRQRLKNRELLFDKKQIEADKEIYNLMISEKVKFQEGINKEKRRVSEELHDGILGKLFGTRLSLDSLNESVSKHDMEERAACINELQLIEEDIRKISHNLQSHLYNSDSSFEKMIEELVSKQSKISQFEWELNFNNLTNFDEISNKIIIHCYRALQEILQNINKYASADKVEINLEEKGNLWLFEVNDNGIGFDTKQKYKGIGLKNIKSRVESLKGEVDIISKPGFGTQIKMIIPVY